MNSRYFSKKALYAKSKKKVTFFFVLANRTIQAALFFDFDLLPVFLQIIFVYSVLLARSKLMTIFVDVCAMLLPVVI